MTGELTTSERLRLYANLSESVTVQVSPQVARWLADALEREPEEEGTSRWMLDQARSDLDAARRAVRVALFFLVLSVGQFVCLTVYWSMWGLQ